MTDPTSDPTPRIAVDIRLDGVEVGDRTLTYPLVLDEIAELWDEEPWKLDASAKARTRGQWIWEESGVTATVKNELYAELLQFDTEHFDVHIEGRPYGETFDEQGPTYPSVDFGTGYVMARRDSTRDAHQRVRTISVSQKVPRAKAKAKPKPKPKQAEPAEPAAQPDVDAAVFVDLNVKLAVVQVLMYELGLLQPVFDVTEFVEAHADRDIDLAREGHRPIPEVVAHFEALPVPRSLLAEVTSIFQDGGNDIHLQVAPLWDGEDDTFDITDVTDLEQLPNLETVTLMGASEQTLEALRSRGITAELL